MSITHKYTLVCDDVRVENNNKLIVIGLYTGQMTVPSIPFALPTLCFFQMFESERPGQVGFRATLTHLDSGKNLATAMGMMGIPKPGNGVSIIKFGNLQISAPGTYLFSVQVNGNTDPITTTFDVVLLLPQTTQATTMGTT